jgi:hypothetical protein
VCVLQGPSTVPLLCGCAVCVPEVRSDTLAGCCAELLR